MANFGDRCPKRVSDGRFGYSACRYALKTQEQVDANLCGLHLSGQRRRAARATKAEREEAESRDKEKSARRLTNILAEHGIEANPHYYVPIGAGLGGYTGRIEIDAENAERLVMLLKRGGYR